MFEILALNVSFIEEIVGLLRFSCITLNHYHHFIILLRLRHHGTPLIRGLNPNLEDLNVLFVTLGGGEQALGLHSDVFDVLHPLIRLILQ